MKQMPKFKDYFDPKDHELTFKMSSKMVKDEKERKHQTVEKWKKDLQIYFNLKDVFFDACYEEAMKIAHSKDYDKIANCMHDMVAFSKKIIKLHSDILELK